VVYTDALASSKVNKTALGYALAVPASRRNTVSIIPSLNFFVIPVFLYTLSPVLPLKNEPDAEYS
jgi:hypothetical protein